MRRLLVELAVCIDMAGELTAASCCVPGRVVLGAVSGGAVDEASTGVRGDVGCGDDLGCLCRAGEERLVGEAEEVRACNDDKRQASQAVDVLTRKSAH